MITYFLDIAPLLGSTWTGIAEVSRNLARYFLRHHRDHSVFFHGADVIDSRYVALAIEYAPGAYLKHFIDAGDAVAASLHHAIKSAGITVGIFPHVKPFQQFFDLEVLIVHDLSPLLVPELHTPDVATFFGRALATDAAHSDLICCVSAATKADLELYLAVPCAKTFVAYLGGPELPEFGPVTEASPYAVIIGTIEPRKNLRLVADFLRYQPDVCKDLSMLFVGRSGWGPQADDLFEFVREDPILRHRVGFSGYLPERAKFHVLRGARFLIYPSLFEGFGLPVVEAMAVGCPVIASRSSSIVELGLPEAYLFDPLSISDFARAFHAVNTLPAEAVSQLRLTLQQAAQAFTWRDFGDTIMARIGEWLRQGSATAPVVATALRAAQ